MNLETPKNTTCIHLSLSGLKAMLKKNLNVTSQKTYLLIWLMLQTTCPLPLGRSLVPVAYHCFCCGVRSLERREPLEEETSTEPADYHGGKTNPVITTRILTSSPTNQHFLCGDLGIFWPFCVLELLTVEGGINTWRWYRKRDVLLVGSTTNLKLVSLLIAVHTSQKLDVLFAFHSICRSWSQKDIIFHWRPSLFQAFDIPQLKRILGVLSIVTRTTNTYLYQSWSSRRHIVVISWKLIASFHQKKKNYPSSPTSLDPKTLIIGNWPKGLDLSKISATLWFWGFLGASLALHLV